MARRRSMDLFDDKNPVGLPLGTSAVESSYLGGIGLGEQTLVGSVKTTTVTWTPPVTEVPGRLPPGEATTPRHIGSSRTVGGRLPGQAAVDRSETTRFVGREWLQVPAGRVAACRFEVVTGHQSGGEVRSAGWLYRSVTPREEATTRVTMPSVQIVVGGTVTDELPSATIYGQALQ